MKYLVGMKYHRWIIADCYDYSITLVFTVLFKVPMLSEMHLKAACLKFGITHSWQMKVNWLFIIYTANMLFILYGRSNHLIDFNNGIKMKSDIRLFHHNFFFNNLKYYIMI